MDFEILEGDIENPTLIAVNGEQQDVVLEYWTQALEFVRVEMGIPDDAPEFLAAVIQVYLEMVAREVNKDEDTPLENEEVMENVEDMSSGGVSGDGV